MRILQVNKYLYRRGGAEHYFLDLADLQRQRGHEVELFSMAHSRNLPATYSEHFPTEVELHPAPEGLAGKARAAGRMIWSTSARRGARAVVESFQPDIVHCHNVYHQLSPSVLGALASTGAPVVMTLHDFKLACPTYQFYRDGQRCQECLGGKFHRAVANRCMDGSLAASAVVATESTLHRLFGAYDPVDAFLCPSRFLADTMAAGGIAPERLHHLPNFLALPTLPERHPEPGRFLFVGRLIEGKGVDMAIRAVGRIDGARLDICGEGPAEAELRQLADELAPGRIEFHGQVTKDEVAGHLGVTQALLLPVRWIENLPFTVIEAQSCGVPVVASALGGITELVRDNIDGRLVPPDDLDALVGALSTFTDDPSASERMGRAARTNLDPRFDPTTHAEALEALYDELRARRHSGATR